MRIYRWQGGLHIKPDAPGDDALLEDILNAIKTMKFGKGAIQSAEQKAIYSQQERDIASRHVRQSQAKEMRQQAIS